MEVMSLDDDHDDPWLRTMVVASGRGGRDDGELAFSSSPFHEPRMDRMGLTAVERRRANEADQVADGCWMDVRAGSSSLGQLLKVVEWNGLEK